MKKIFMAIVLCLVCTLISSCTEQMLVREFGGTLTIDVPKGYKVTSATWKHAQVFYFIEPMEEGYTPKEKMFIESSSFGINESQIIFKENK